MYKILIIEDDEIIAKSLKTQLESWDYDVKIIEDFHQVMTVFHDYQPHLVLLDLYLPTYNGFHYCKEIRKVSQVPIIYISSANENMNIVMAMNMGGDDFINKPFDLNVLIAKIQAILRRTYDFSKETHKLVYSGVTLDLLNGTLMYQDQVLELTKNEMKILEILFERKEMIVSREDIMNQLWDDYQFVDDNTLSVNMNRLRKKCEDIGLVDFIHTKKGMGYMLCLKTI